MYTRLILFCLFRVALVHGIQQQFDSIEDVLAHHKDSEICILSAATVTIREHNLFEYSPKDQFNPIAGNCICPALHDVDTYDTEYATLKHISADISRPQFIHNETGTLCDEKSMGCVELGHGLSGSRCLSAAEIPIRGFGVCASHIVGVKTQTDKFFKTTAVVVKSHPPVCVCHEGYWYNSTIRLNDVFTTGHIDPRFAVVFLDTKNYSRFSCSYVNEQDSETGRLLIESIYTTRLDIYTKNLTNGHIMRVEFHQNIREYKIRCVGVNHTGSEDVLDFVVENNKCVSTSETTAGDAETVGPDPNEKRSQIHSDLPDWMSVSIYVSVGFSVLFFVAVCILYAMNLIVWPQRGIRNYYRVEDHDDDDVCPLLV